MNPQEIAKQVSDAKKRGETPEEYQNQLARNAEKSAQNWYKGFQWLGGRLSDLWKGLTGQTSAEAQLKANEMNIANQNYWNMRAEQREDTAYQRQMADLQAAGLNPWLSVGGSGAQAASMSTATADPVDGSKMLQATTAAALIAAVKIIGSLATKKISSSGTKTNINYNFKR